MAKYIINKNVPGQPDAFSNVEIEATNYEYSDGYFTFTKPSEESSRVRSKVYTIDASRVLTVAVIPD